MSGFKRNNSVHNSEDLNGKECKEHHYREPEKEVYVKKTKNKSIKLGIASRERCSTENRKSMDKQQGKRVRSHSGYADGNHSLTLPGRGTRPRAATLATSRDDLLMTAKPYVYGPKRQAPRPPPTRQQQKSSTLPRRRAPPPPPSSMMDKSRTTESQETEESLYTLPDKSHHNRVSVSHNGPPPIPNTPRPSLINIGVLADCESIYEETTGSYSTPVKESPPLPAPPLPPRSSTSAVQPPALPPRSCPPTFKPPPIDPSAMTPETVPSPLHPPLPPLFVPSDNEIQDIEVQEEYSDTLLNCIEEHIEDDEYILMDEAIKCRDLYKQLQDGKTSSGVDKSLLEDEDTESNYMQMAGPTTAGYVKMMRDSLTKGTTTVTSKPPPIPPKPALEPRLTKRMVVPKQKMSFPHLPPPSPPQIPSSQEEMEDTVYEPIHQEEEQLYY